MSKDQAEVNYDNYTYWETVLVAPITLSEQAYHYITELDPSEAYVLRRLLSVGRILLPRIGDYQLDYLMLQTVEDFFSWYSSQAANPHVTAIRLNLMEIVSGPEKWMTVTAANPEAFSDLKSLIIDTFEKLKEESPSLSIFRVEITALDHRQDAAGTWEILSRRHIPWMNGSLII
jgi:hypothetical protein